MDPETVLKSILGTFTEGNPFVPDLIWTEIFFWQAKTLSKNRANAMDGACELLKQVRL
jgi:hypothetical protein